MYITYLQSIRQLQDLLLARVQQCVLGQHAITVDGFIARACADTGPSIPGAQTVAGQQRHASRHLAGDETAYTLHRNHAVKNTWHTSTLVRHSAPSELLKQKGGRACDNNRAEADGGMPRHTTRSESQQHHHFITALGGVKRCITCYSTTRLSANACVLHIGPAQAHVHRRQSTPQPLRQSFIVSCRTGLLLSRVSCSGC